MKRVREVIKDKQLIVASRRRHVDVGVAGIWTSLQFNLQRLLLSLSPILTLFLPYCLFNFIRNNSDETPTGDDQLVAQQWSTKLIIVLV